MYYKHIKQIVRDLNAYKAVKPYLKDYLPIYEETLVETHLGPGLVCEIIRDDDGNTSKMLSEYLCSKKLTHDIVEQIKDFGRIIDEHYIPFYDMNPNNFLVQIKNGKQKVLYIDMKYYNDYKPWIYLHLEKVIPALSRMIVRRRFQRLMKTLSRYLITE